MRFTKNKEIENETNVIIKGTKNKMDNQIKKEIISKKEMDLKKMKLSQSQEGITNLTVSDEKERKKLWDEWKTQQTRRAHSEMPGNSGNKKGFSCCEKRTSKFR